MAQILRLRGPDQIYGARGWSLFRLSYHRLVGQYSSCPQSPADNLPYQQKQQLTFKQERQPTLPESEVWLDSLDEAHPHVCIEKENSRINKICLRARNLRKRIDDTDIPAEQTLEMLKEIHELDRTATTWRQGPHRAYKTIRHSEMGQNELSVPKHPDFIQLHRDVWMAYEWNYHRTARIVLHEQLLECLD